MKVLFVCSGNICRSAMAEACFRHRTRGCSVPDLEIGSAGTLNIDGAPASAEAIEALAEVGIDLANHRSRGIRARDLAESDWVVAMTRGHLAELEQRFPDGRSTRVLLRAFEEREAPATDAPDLEDPIGRPVEFYRQQLGVVIRCLDHLASHLGLSR